MIRIEMSVRRVCEFRIKNGGEIHRPREPGDHAVVLVFLLLQAVRAPDHIVQRAEPEGRHDFADLLRDEPHKVHDVFRLSGKPLPELLVLGRDADRTRVLRADPHHHASHAHKRRCGEAEFLRAEHGRDDHISAGHQLAIRLDADPIPESVLNQALMCLRDAEFPRQARVMHGAVRRRAGASVVAGDQNDLRSRLGHAARDRADTVLRDKLHGDTRTPVCVLEIINQLRQILDGINIVVRRRRNQGYARRGVADLRDPRVHLSPGQMAALARLGSLRHLDLDFLRAAEVSRRHTEASRCDLLDRTVPVRAEPRRVLSALAGVGFTAEGIHRLRQRLMRLLRDRPEGHGPCLEPAHNGFDRLHLLQRDRIPCRDKIHEAAQGVRARRLVDALRVFLKLFKIPGPHRLL